MAFLFAIVLCMVATAHDLRTGRIPNRLTLGALGLTLGGVFAFRGVGGLGSSILGALVAGAVPLWLTLRGRMGGGDLKLFAALGALLGARAGVFVELATLATLHALPARIERAAAPAILAGVLFVALLHLCGVR